MSSTGGVSPFGEAYTSQICHNCHAKDESARKTQGLFHCRNCGLQTNADYNGSMNIMQRALGITVKSWGHIDYPRTFGDGRKESYDHERILRTSAVGIVKYQPAAIVRMSSSMMRMTKKSAGQPDETRKFDKGKIEITNFGETSIGKATFEPGWQWSKHVKPIVGGNSCQVTHTTYVISGRIHVKMDDGSEMEYGPGDSGIVPPGHDAWVVGNENFVAVDFTGAKTYAKK